MRVDIHKLGLYIRAYRVPVRAFIFVRFMVFMEGIASLPDSGWEGESIRRGGYQSEELQSVYCNTGRHHVKPLRSPDFPKPFPSCAPSSSSSKGPHKAQYSRGTIAPYTTCPV